MRLLRGATAVVLALVAIVVAIWLGGRAFAWNDELALPRPPLADEPPHLDDPHTPRLTQRVVLIIIDGLGADEADLPFLDELRARGASTIARVPYPTISRPNYVTLLTGVPPRDSGVRSNRVRAPVAVDTVMDRVQAGGMRVATASDFGVLASLFLRHTSSISDVAWVADRAAPPSGGAAGRGRAPAVDGTRLRPPPPLTWPVDDARRVPSLDALGTTIADLARDDAALIAVLVLDVDRAGHAAGVGPEYRATARAVDQMVRRAFAGLDLAHDTVVVTADHGHVAPGGHGGVEPEVARVPLIFAGSGIARGAIARDARSIDVAPTIAALLGVPAPGHAEGRALVELLQLAPADAARRADADASRTRALAAITDAAIAADTRPSAARLALLALGAVLAGALAVVLRRRGAVAITRAAPVAIIAFVVMLLAMVAMTRGRMSPSFVPSLARVELLGAIGAGIAVGAQLLASWCVLRRAPDRLAAANGLAFVGLAGALATVAAVRAWFSPPFIDVPGPCWMVAIPAVDLAAAVCAIATVLTLLFATVLPRRRG